MRKPRWRAKSLSFLFVLCLAPAVSAQENGGWKIPRAFSLFIDQDVFFGPSFDQDFTMGVLATWSDGWVREHWVSWPLDRLDSVLAPLSGNGLKSHYGFSPVQSFAIGHSAFTPSKDNLFERTPLPNDRPYANLLFVMVRREVSALKTKTVEGDVRVDVPLPSAYSSDLTVGVLGLGIAGSVQAWIHRHISDDITPGGWHNEISRGGELTARYRLSQKRLIVDRTAGGATPAWTSQRLFDAHVFLEESVGFYTYLAGGGRFRFGRINSPWWTGERMPNSVVKAAPSSRVSRSELYVHGGIAGTVWAYNALMQGQSKETAVALDFGDCTATRACLTRANYDFQVGVTWRRGDFSAGYQVTALSPLFRTQVDRELKGRTHTWGGVYLTWRN